MQNPNARSGSPPLGDQVSSLEPWQESFVDEVAERLARDSHLILEEIHRRVDKVVFACVLQETGGNISQACARLGISRPTFRHRLRQLGLAS